MENINKLYKSAGKCDNQHQYKSTLEASIFSTPECFTVNSPTSHGPSVTVKNPSARKSLYLFTEFFYIKNKTTVRRVDADKSKLKAVVSGSMLWSSITNMRGHKIINKGINKYLYNWILQDPQALQSPIVDDFPEVCIDNRSELQLVPKLLLQFST